MIAISAINSIYLDVLGLLHFRKFGVVKDEAVLSVHGNNVSHVPVY